MASFRRLTKFCHCAFHIFGFSILCSLFSSSFLFAFISFVSIREKINCYKQIFERKSLTAFPAICIALCLETEFKIPNET